LMSKIYSKAAKVIVWLGREGKDSSGALEIQNNFGGSLFDLWEEGDLTRKDVQAHNPEDPCYLNIFRLQKMSVKVLFSWTQFYRRSWFFRRWTLQETALARQIDILCGNQIVDWQKLNFLDWYFGTSGWRLFMSRSIDADIPFRALQARRFVSSVSYNPEGWAGDCLTSYGSFNFGTVLTEVLYKCGGLQCSDPRDNVYGILGVVEDIFHLHDTCPLVVDYEIEVEGLYLTMTKTLVETVPNLAILSLVRDPSQRSILSLPSWAPNIHHITKLPFDIRLGLSRKKS
jgi:hypothetical protein